MMTRVRIHWPGNIATARATSHDVLGSLKLRGWLTVNGTTTLDAEEDALLALRELASQGTIRLEEMEDD